ncbi:hypothetical protein BSK59_08485 [Paenibacillus odorifer]|uniref:DUF3892 domain-containing protein n=1 Tax=Paenibacillus TaxID=44249 RepID=UPI00096FDFF6|nr:DUF3892 domain-containing protein [Paenibacillus odorifer]OME58211.1 hypothetical protein BSK59_08485 [Paenibacillus odorifer]
MSYQITHIRLSVATPTSSEHIKEVKLSSGVIETVAQVVKYIDSKMEYFYTTSAGSKAIVESVHPSGRAAYIRTKGNSTTSDNLLNLPRF